MSLGCSLHRDLKYSETASRKRPQEKKHTLRDEQEKRVIIQKQGLSNFLAYFRLLGCISSAPTGWSDDEMDDVQSPANMNANNSAPKRGYRAEADHVSLFR
jgi:hypothetical protein